MNQFRSNIRTVFENITEPHPSITDPRKRMKAETVSFMTLVMILGVSLDLIFGSGLSPLILIVSFINYWFSRTRRYRISIYLIIVTLLYGSVHSTLVGDSYTSYVLFANLAWLSMSLIFASLLLSIRETVLIAVGHLIILYLLVILVPEIDLHEMVITFGYLGFFSTLLIITKWQRNIIEDARQEEIRQQATHDQLTGLPNRSLFYDRLAGALARLERNDSIGAILYLDLDDFKNVNDEYSHEIGDQVLKVIAKRILGSIRKMDTGARFSGDEFVILLEDVGGSRNAARIAKKLLNTISSPIHIQDSDLVLSGSIGIAMMPKDGKDASELLINADTAMYNTKDDGKNSISFFTRAMKERMLISINLSNSMQMGLERREFYLDYQPQYDASTGEIFGAEALLRWQHPQMGKISPREFIPIADKNGMIIPMGKWVIEDVFLFHQSLESALHQNIKLAANISGRQLRDEQFMSYLSELIEGSGVDPAFLELEITENNLFENIDRTLSILKDIKSLGVRLAMDDFGIGYSSLSYLDRLPFDTVKIDKSFIHKIKNLKVHLPILEGIISIATEMGLDVIAEGVEDNTQLSYLLSHDCHLIQGHFFNPSFSEGELLRMVMDQNGSVLQQPVTTRMT